MPQSVVPPSPTEPPPGFAVAPGEARAAAEAWRPFRPARRRAPRPARDCCRAHRRRRSAHLPGGLLHAPRALAVRQRHPSGGGRERRDRRGARGVDGPAGGHPAGPRRRPPLGRALNKPWVWLPLAALFPAALRRPAPGRCGWSTSTWCCSASASPSSTSTRAASVSVRSCTRCSPTCWCVPCWPGSGRGLGEALVPWLPMRWLAIRLVLLVAFRVGLNVQDSTVIDVGHHAEHGRRRSNRARRKALRAERCARRHLRAGQLPRLPALRGAALAWDGSWGAVPARRTGGGARPAHDHRPDAARLDPPGGSGGRAPRPRSPSPGRPTPSPSSCSRRTPTTGWSRPCSCSRW